MKSSDPAGEQAVGTLAGMPDPPGPQDGSDASDGPKKRPRAPGGNPLTLVPPPGRREAADEDSVPDVPPVVLTPSEVAVLLDDVRALLRRYMVMTDAQADTVAVWILHTWVFDQYYVTPYLAVLGPTYRTGKTRLLIDLPSKLVRNPLETSDITAAALYRAIDHEPCTLLYDEIDQGKMPPEKVSILNGGYKKGGSVRRTVNHVSTRFSTFCPKAFGAIGVSALTPTLIDRSIQIYVDRRLPDEPVAKFREERVTEEAAPIMERLQVFGSCWARPGEEPALPDTLDDRQEELWLPLMEIAGYAGDEWSRRIWAAAVTLTDEAGHTQPDEFVSLLLDIHEVWGSDVPAMHSVELVRRLNAMDDPSCTDTSITHSQKTLANWLGDRLRIHSRNVTIDKIQKKGYQRSQFTDAFRRYLPPTELVGGRSPTVVARPHWRGAGEHEPALRAAWAAARARQARPRARHFSPAVPISTRTCPAASGRSSPTPAAGGRGGPSLLRLRVSSSMDIALVQALDR